MAPGEEKQEHEIFDKIVKNDINAVRTLLAQEGKAVTDVMDDHGMTPIQHAAYKGSKEIVQLLLDQGACVNSGKHEYGYTALHFAALSGKVDVCQILLNNGAKVSATNSVGRTPSQMAAFVGNHACVSVINNFVPKQDVEYYSVPAGLETEPKISPLLVDPLHTFLLMQVNLNPVRIAMNLMKFPQICENLDKVKTVLELMSKREMNRTDINEIMSLKFHYLSCIVGEVAKHKKLQATGKEKREEEEGGSTGGGKGKPADPVELFIKRMLKPGKGGELELEDAFLRDCVREFPHRESTLFRQVVTSLAKGDTTHALPVIVAAINGQRGFADSEVLICSTCGEENASKKCSKCKTVQYCDRECQRLHWFVHKKHCSRVATGPQLHNEAEEKKEAIMAATEALKSQLNLGGF